MGEIKALLELDYASVIIGLFVGLFAVKSVVSIIEWFCVKLGIETKWNRQKREEHELLMTTVNTVKDIQEQHKKDKAEVKTEISELESSVSEFITEMRSIISETQNSIQEYGEKRIQDRKVSIERERRINDRIDSMITLDDSRDGTIKEIGSDLKKLTGMFVEKEISDYRWHIINFATNISIGKECTQEAYNWCFQIYEKYEKILEENGLENGQVELSMEVINESYKNKLKNGFK